VGTAPAGYVELLQDGQNSPAQDNNPSESVMTSRNEERLHRFAQTAGARLRPQSAGSGPNKPPANPGGASTARGDQTARTLRRLVGRSPRHSLSSPRATYARPEGIGGSYTALAEDTPLESASPKQPAGKSLVEMKPLLPTVAQDATSTVLGQRTNAERAANVRAAYEESQLSNKNLLRPQQTGGFWR
jgi:hypothetical protein